MIKAIKLEIKNLAYKIPTILKITAILSGEDIIKAASHSKNIELCASLYGYKSFASLDVHKDIDTKSIFTEKLEKFYSELTPKQLDIFSEILKNQKFTSKHVDENYITININNSPNESLWESRYISFVRALADQIIRITSLVHWKNNIKIYLILFSNYSILETFLKELDFLELLSPLMQKYLDSLPSSTKEVANLQHGFITMKSRLTTVS